MVAGDWIRGYLVITADLASNGLHRGLSFVQCNVNEKYSLQFYRIDKGYRFINMNFSFLHSNMLLLYTSLNKHNTCMRFSHF